MKTKQLFLTLIGTCAIVAGAAASETVSSGKNKTAAVVAFESTPAATLSLTAIHAPSSDLAVPVDLYDLGQELSRLEETRAAAASELLAHTKVENLELTGAIRYTTDWNRIEQQFKKYQSVAAILEHQQKIDREITEM